MKGVFSLAVLSTLLILILQNLKIANHAKISHAVVLYASGKMCYFDAYNIAYMKSKEYTKAAPLT
jgi:hypothetical protein